jgi:light-regulated signal transduction histidine kinase (bacteriophytochrome)
MSEIETQVTVVTVATGRPGLGLAMVHGIVADFGGSIDVATQVGAGSTFTIWLPDAGEKPVLRTEPVGEVLQSTAKW